MSHLRLHNFAISLDGFATGEGQTREAPFGHAGERLHEWMFDTEFFHAMGGRPGGSRGVDNAFARQHGPGIGAEIMGVGKYGHPGWEDDPDWKGAWGPNPPFHTPVFVLTHHAPRPSIEMEGGTTFHFVDAPPAEALRRPARPPPGWTSAWAAARPWSASSWPPAWSMTCTSWSCRSCSAAACACGTAWRASSRTTTSRPSRRPAA
jgi:hypothetical protein